MKPARYSRTVLISILLLTGVLALFNLSVDPYGIFGSPTYPGLNEAKPEAGSQLRLVKAYTLRSHGYRGLILGNSKPLRSMDPSHPLIADYRYYNASLSDASIEELWYYLLHADHAGSIRHVMLFLHPSLYGVVPEPKTDFSRKRLHGEEFSITQKVIDYRDALLTSSALRASLSTLAHQESPDTELTDGGMLILNRARPDALKIFRKTESFFVDANLRRTAQASSSPVAPEDSYYYQLSRFIAYCHERDIQLIMIIPPMHARLQEVYRLTDDWERMENWKRGVVKLNEQLASAIDHSAYPIWDFSILTPMSTEKIEKNVSSEWHFDASHFRPNYGALILRALFDDNPDATVDGLQLAMRLDSGSVDHVLQHINQQQKQWRMAHPDTAAELANMANARGAL